MAAPMTEPDVYAGLRRTREAARNRVPYESGNYPYVTARVKAKKAGLYPPETYPRLLQMEIPQIARFLGEGPYKEELVALGARVRGVDLVEQATSQNLAKTFTEVIEMSEGGLRAMIGAYLDRWDVANIKTILRGKLYGATAEDVFEDLVPAGSLETEFLRGLVDLPTVDDVFAALDGTIYAEARRELGEAFDPAKGLAAYEDALAQDYYRSLLASIQPRTDASRHFLEFIRKEIDILNLKTLLRAWKAKASFEHPIFLDGGLELTPADLSGMVGLELNALLARLARTSLAAEAGAALRAMEQGGVASVERNLEKFHLKEASRHSHLHPLSVLPVLDFLSRKTREVQNLRIIARGKEHGIPTDAIRELLVI